MFHREAGVFKTSYAADMALFPLPIARWAVAALRGAVYCRRAAGLLLYTTSRSSICA